jgi:hypothetical protein
MYFVIPIMKADISEVDSLPHSAGIVSRHQVSSQIKLSLQMGEEAKIPNEDINTLLDNGNKLAGSRDSAHRPQYPWSEHSSWV